MDPGSLGALIGIAILGGLVLATARMERNLSPNSRRFSEVTAREKRPGWIILACAIHIMFITPFAFLTAHRGEWLYASVSASIVAVLVFASFRSARALVDARRR